MGAWASSGARGTSDWVARWRSRCCTRGWPTIPSLRERFEREAAALARLEHPNLVRLYDVLESGGQTMLVLGSWTATRWTPSSAAGRSTGPTRAGTAARWPRRSPMRMRAASCTVT